ncbi:MAG: cell division protein FtsZ [Proteobacteria bacterium]|nr:cell division protein FtsZ [Pseudomonadota bacterium]
MSLNIAMVKDTVHQPRIMVIGVGGGGGNAVENMIKAKLGGATFAVANTDLQVLEAHGADVKIQLGKQLTEGLGAGANPEVGGAAAEESYEEICEAIRGSHMVFVTAGMGGGTGTGAAPVVARAAREMGILTVAVVTKPFSFEGTRRMKQAESGIAELQDVADTVIVIPNQNLFRVATERTTLQDAFKLADDVLYKGVRGVTDLMLVPGIINLDFNDVKTVMSEMGQAMMGTGEAEGERRAILAAELAISSPLLDGISMAGAKGVLINITGGDDLTLYEVDEAANRIREEVDPDANIIFGTAYDKEVTGKIRVSVVATGLGEVRAAKKNTVDLSVLKKAEPMREESVKAAEVKDFGQALAAKQRDREDDADEYANLEIPAFLRRQAN